MKKEHILVIRFSSLGDVAMTVPVVWALAHQYPDIRITVLSRKYARTLFDDLAPNVNFMEADLKVEYHGIKGLNSLYIIIKRGGKLLHGSFLLGYQMATVFPMLVDMLYPIAS